MFGCQLWNFRFIECCQLAVVDKRLNAIVLHFTWQSKEQQVNVDVSPRETAFFRLPFNRYDRERAD